MEREGIYFYQKKGKTEGRKSENEKGVTNSANTLPHFGADEGTRTRTPCGTRS
jgi:hypothetical protein